MDNIDVGSDTAADVFELFAALSSKGNALDKTTERPSFEIILPEYK